MEVLVAKTSSRSHEQIPLKNDLTKHWEMLINIDRPFWMLLEEPETPVPENGMPWHAA